MDRMQTKEQGRTEMTGTNQIEVPMAVCDGKYMKCKYKRTGVVS